jgi:hypothetical protein
MSIEVRALKDSGKAVLWVDEKDAEFFGVYEGGPGVFRWIADFAAYDDAIAWATDRADRKQTDLHNHVRPA